MTCPDCENVARAAARALWHASTVMEKLVDHVNVTESDWQRLYLLTAQVGELSSILDADTKPG